MTTLKYMQHHYLNTLKFALFYGKGRNREIETTLPSAVLFPKCSQQLGLDQENLQPRISARSIIWVIGTQAFESSSCCLPEHLPRGSWNKEAL